MNMFYSQCLISKKGPLRNVWIAAHFHKKLKKEQVNLTNISSSVDKILVDVPVVTYRILGYLLLGIVRIYSKKVEYLEHDCHSVMTKISDFAVSKKATAPPVEVMGIPYYSSITLPATFELDAFDLEVSDCASGEHTKSRTDIILEGKNEGIGTHSFAKYLYEEDGAQFEDYSAHTHVSHTHSLYLDDTMIQDSRNLSNMEPSMEKLRDCRFSLEERFDPMILGEPEEEEDNVTPVNDINETNGEHIKSSGFGNVFGDDAKKAKFSEVTTLENEELQTTSEKCPMSITVDVTPESKVPNASGATSPELMAVRTPATKDRSRVLKKRKIVFDEDRVIPGKEYKQWLDESSDLVRERKKAPSALQCQKARQISNLPQSLFEPLIPCTFSDHRNLICQKKNNSPEPVENVETTSKTDGLESPRIHRSPDPESSIAPSTPVTQSTSLRYSEMRSSNIFDKEGPSMSFQSTEKDCQDFDLSFINEELSSCEGNSMEKHKWSVKTRAVANYLHKNFLTRKKKREDEEELNLSQVLKGRTKQESARLFYEILVLKNGGYIDVKQENAYDEIVVVETHKLKKACES